MTHISTRKLSRRCKSVPNASIGNKGQASSGHNSACCSARSIHNAAARFLATHKRVAPSASPSLRALPSTLPHAGHDAGYRLCAHTARAQRLSCQAVWRAEACTERGGRNRAGVLAHLQWRGRETDSSKVVFNSETKCSMGRSDCDKVRWSSFTARSGKHQLRGGLWRRNPRKLRFERPSLDPPRSRCARRHLRGLSKPASRASRPPPTPCGSLPDEPRDQATAKTECWEILDYRATGCPPLPKSLFSKRCGTSWEPDPLMMFVEVYCISAGR